MDINKVVDEVMKVADGQMNILSAHKKSFESRTMITVRKPDGSQTSMIAFDIEKFNDLADAMFNQSKLISNLMDTLSMRGA